MNPVTSQTPHKFLTPYPELYGTFTLALSEPYGPGPYDTLATPLKPWSTDTKGSAWTSQSCEALSTLGYTYPEIQDWSKTPSQLAKSVIAQVNTLYSDQAFPATPATSHKFIKRAMASGSGQQVIEWSVAISVPKFQLGGKRFIVRLFLGNVPSDPNTWATSSSCVGSFAVFPPSQVPAGLLPDTKAYNEISLGAALKGVGNDGQDVQGVVAYLRSSLQWRVQLVRDVVFLVLWFVICDADLNSSMVQSCLLISIRIWMWWSRRRLSRFQGVCMSFQPMGRRRRILRSQRGSKVGIRGESWEMSLGLRGVFTPQVTFKTSNF
jgi:hypothetical protein